MASSLRPIEVRHESLAWRELPHELLRESLRIALRVVIDGRERGKRALAPCYTYSRRISMACNRKQQDGGTMLQSAAGRAWCPHAALGA